MTFGIKRIIRIRFLMVIKKRTNALVRFIPKPLEGEA